METVAIAAHAPRRVAAAIRVRTAAAADIQRRAAVDIQVPIVAVADIQRRATAVADTQLHVAVVAAGIPLPVAAEVVVAGSTPPEATTGLIADDKNFELLPGGPPSRPLFFFFCLSESSFARGAPTLACCDNESMPIPSFVLLTADGEQPTAAVINFFAYVGSQGPQEGLRENCRR
jgi:hypothetical protein